MLSHTSSERKENHHQNGINDFQEINFAEERNANDVANSSTIRCSLASSCNERDLSKRDKIRQWALKHNLTRSAVSELLILLNEWLPSADFCKDARTLLKTPRNVVIQNIGGGQFHHFGISRWILDSINLGLVNFPQKHEALMKVPNLISLKIGVDGLPISDSSKLQFWPILLSVDQAKYKKVYVASLFLGDHKPNNLEEFLKPFVSEMKILENEGILHDSIKYNVRIRCILADAPARSFLKNIKGHTGYYGCERCFSKGSHINKKLHYSISCGSILYNDQSFKNQTYTLHHQGKTPLTDLQLGAVSQIPLDYMHLVCLGVTKKLIKTWVEGPLRLSSKVRKDISERLVSFRCRIPSNFARKCRSIWEVAYWKATEFRLFILYVGPSALVDILDTKKYKHFLLLHTAIYIYISKAALLEEWVIYAKTLVERFVEQIPKLYHKDFLTYNMHSIQHLYYDVLNHGQLDNVSCFEFENHMQNFKRMLRGKSNHLVQVVKRIEESDWMETESYLCKPNDLVDSYRNNCFFTDNGSLVLVQGFSEDNTLVKVKTFMKQDDVADYPVKSSKLSIFIVSDLCDNQIEVMKSSLSQKCVLLPYRDKNICIPLCNSS